MIAGAAAKKPKNHAFFLSWYIVIGAGLGRWYYNKYKEAHSPTNAASVMNRRATMSRMNNVKIANNTSVVDNKYALGPRRSSMGNPNLISRKSSRNPELNSRNSVSKNPDLPSGASAGKL